MSDFSIVAFAATYPSRACCLSVHIRVPVGTLPASTHIFFTAYTEVRVGVTLDWLTSSLGPLIGASSFHGCSLLRYGTHGYIGSLLLLLLVVLLVCIVPDQHSR